MKVNKNIKEKTLIKSGFVRNGEIFTKIIPLHKYKKYTTISLVLSVDTEEYDFKYFVQDNSSNSLYVAYYQPDYVHRDFTNLLQARIDKQLKKLIKAGVLVE